MTTLEELSDLYSNGSPHHYRKRIYKLTGIVCGSCLTFNEQGDSILYFNNVSRPKTDGKINKITAKYKNE
jgi:hypothetical protein